MVTVGQKRVKTIDVHAHCAIPEAVALMGSKAGAQATGSTLVMGPERLRQMDAGYRYGSAQHQSLLVRRRARPRGEDHQDPARRPRRAVLRPAGPFCGFRHGRAAISRSRRTAVGIWREENRAARSFPRREY